MVQQPNEDLFEPSKMTFGEHLEELRVCLVRALIGLAIGFLIGLLFAGAVVRKIEVPLKSALDKFYFEKAVSELKSEYGKDVPADLQSFMQADQMVYEEVYWETIEIERILDSLNSTNLEIDESVEQITGKVVVGAGPGPPTSVFVKTRIWKPLDARITSLSAHEPFMIWLKAALITGAVISSPWVFWHVWSFVAAGLYPHEKNHVYFVVPFSLGLFLAGAAMAFFFVFEPVLEFLFGFNKLMKIDPDPRISEWMSFVLFLPLGFGISFQLPLVMLVLDRIGVMSVKTYLEKWRIAVLVIFVVAMLLTPADPISMLLMAGPLTCLYFGGIALCHWLPKRKNPFGEGYDPA
ncbi:MAG: twin-arginine translocase subunit TatC [Pirellulaceae bacterium]|nr:twin-arginine translocase subunit TatC [Pirellulaceae bacterium]